MENISPEGNPRSLPPDAIIPTAWSDLQQRLAEDSGLALLLVEGHQPPALIVSQNNSICRAIQSSPEHAALCDPYCGEAHQRALKSGGTAHYRCHAGLNCFTR